MEKIEVFWTYLKRFWLSKPSFINSWNINHHDEEKTEDLKSTNNGLERYNRTLKSLLSDKTPSLLNFINVIEEESRDQVIRLDCIRNGLVDNCKRKLNINHDDSNRNKISKFYHEFEAS